MSTKVLLVLVDGMRPDGLLACGHPFVQKLLDNSSHALDAQTVMPSVTLPCHMSLFHSVDPARHGVTTNTYMPQVRPIVGLVDRLAQFEKKCAMFYTWEELRDLSRPGHLHTSQCMSIYQYPAPDKAITAAAIEYIGNEEPDFLFLYLGETDETGHKCGWMGGEYLAAINNAMSCIERAWDSLPEGYTMIVVADHGGHDRTHGTEQPSDMTIPVCILGDGFEKGRTLESVSIKDIAPTIASLLDVPAVKEWEGKKLNS